MTRNAPPMTRNAVVFSYNGVLPKLALRLRQTAEAIRSSAQRQIPRWTEGGAE